MKRLIKNMIRPIWRMSGPVRRPIIRKFDHHMMRLLHLLPRPREIPADLDLVLNGVARELARPCEVPAGLDLALNSVVRELTLSRDVAAGLDLALNSVVRELGRLQMRVEDLQQQVDEWQSGDRDDARAEGRLSVVAEIG
jgi:hypothetical protein